MKAFTTHLWMSLWTRFRAAKSFVERHTVVALFCTTIMLMLLFFARVTTITDTLSSQQKHACQLRYAGRANTNTHDRVPLKAALTYLGTLTRGSKDPKAIAFGTQFLAYAAAVQPLPNPKC